MIILFAKEKDFDGYATVMDFARDSITADAFMRDNYILIFIIIIRRHWPNPHLDWMIKIASVRTKAPCAKSNCYPRAGIVVPKGCYPMALVFG